MILILCFFTLGLTDLSLFRDEGKQHLWNSAEKVDGNREERKQLSFLLTRLVRGSSLTSTV